MMKSAQASLEGGTPEQDALARFSAFNENEAKEELFNLCMEPSYNDLNEFGSRTEIEIMSDIKTLFSIKKDLDPNSIKRKDGMTCTLWAVVNGHLAILKYLVEDKGANCDDTIKDNTGKTCTIYAALHGHLEVLKYLVDEKGAKCDDTIKDNDGKSCLDWAKSNNRKSVVDYIGQLQLHKMCSVCNQN
jgi:ankyrin repeat protein